MMARGGLGSTSNCLGVFAVLAGAHVGSCAALRSVNSIVASLGAFGVTVFPRWHQVRILFKGNNGTYYFVGFQTKKLEDWWGKHFP